MLLQPLLRRTVVSRGSYFSTHAITVAASASVSSLAEHAKPPCPSRESQHLVTLGPKWTPPLVKIVATIGPTSEQLPKLQQVVKAGMRIMRLNFSHATDDEVELRVTNLKKCQGRHAHLMEEGDKNIRAILLDTKGPEIRTGKLRGDTSGKETISLAVGNTITLHTDTRWADTGSTVSDLFVDYPSLHTCVQPGCKILLSDGSIQLTVLSTSTSTEQPYGSVLCRIENSGELRSRAGVNLPGIETDLPAMSTKDKRDIKYGMTKDVDYVAASFIQNAQGVQQIRAYMKQCAKELNWDESQKLPLIISKIESVAALKNFDSILQESDGIMVARGDLGVEIPIQQVVLAQKEMVAACNAAGKPVIVATEMLQSMSKSPRPTRAEVADVTNAVFDGADCVMLSGETANGKYPVESVQMMNEIVCSAEKFQKQHPTLIGLGHGRNLFASMDILDVQSKDKRDANASIAKAAVTAATKHDAKAILVYSPDSSLAKFVSAYRPDVPIVVFCSNAKDGRQLIIYRGIHPVVRNLKEVPSGQRPVKAIQYAKELGFIHDGDDVVIVCVDSDEDVGDFMTMKLGTC